MPLSVLIVEDSSTGSLISEYLRTQLAPLSGATLDPNGYKHPDPGDLAHMVPRSWEPYESEDFDVRVLKAKAIKSIIEVAAHDTLVALRNEVMVQFTKAFRGSKGMEPDLLIVDLALSHSETEALIAHGGNRPARPWPDFDPKIDPREKLQEMTGFRVLQACGADMPVIATSYARNPLVTRCCLVNGAHAFLQKPVTDRAGGGEVPPAPKGYDLETAHRMGLTELEHAATQNEDPLAVTVMTYLTSVAAAVLKAVQVIALERADAGRPEGLTRSQTLG